MASPQCEDGYARIANDVLESLARIRIPGEARQVFDIILRKTWGWNKKTDVISLSQLATATGLAKRSIIRARTTLLQMNLISIHKNDTGDAYFYSINKDFDTWRPFTKKTPHNKASIHKNDLTLFDSSKKDTPSEKERSFTETTPDSVIVHESVNGGVSKTHTDGVSKTHTTKESNEQPRGKTAGFHRRGSKSLS